MSGYGVLGSSYLDWYLRGIDLTAKVNAEVRQRRKIQESAIPSVPRIQRESDGVDTDFPVPHHAKNRVQKLQACKTQGCLVPGVDEAKR